MLAWRIPVKQLLWNFITAGRSSGLKKRSRPIRALNTAGYRIFSVSPGGRGVRL